MNKQLFARNNCSAAFTILKDPSDADKGEAVVKIKFDLTDTLYDVRDRMSAAVSVARGETGEAGFTEKLLRFLLGSPVKLTVLVPGNHFCICSSTCSVPTPKYLMKGLPQWGHTEGTGLRAPQ